MNYHIMEMETGSVTDSITAVAEYHSMEIKIDSFIGYITNIYSRDLKLY